MHLKLQSPATRYYIFLKSLSACTKQPFLQCPPANSFVLVCARRPSRHLLIFLQDLHFPFPVFFFSFKSCTTFHHNLTCHLPMLQSVPQSWRHEPFPKTQPSHCLLDTQQASPSSPGTSSPLVTPITLPHRLPTRSPPWFDAHAPHNSPPYTTNRHTTSWTSGVMLSLATSETKNSTHDDAATAATGTVHAASKVCATSHAAVTTRQPSLVDESPCTVVAGSRSSLPRATGQHFLGGLTPRCVSPSKRLKV